MQQGFAHWGWNLIGPGFDDPRHDVEAVLRDINPSHAIIQDHREWHRDQPAAFDKAAHFDNYEALETWGGPTTTILKDAHQDVDYERFHIEIGVDNVIHYYHPDAIRPYVPHLFDPTWGVNLIRTYHTINAFHVPIPDQWPHENDRKPWLVSGAMEKGVYDFRRLAKACALADSTGHVMKHPGYGLKGWRTPDYLRELCRYKVHVCTASKYNYLLRKIIESTACGCVVVTNLPEWDPVPEIDDNLVRVEDESPRGLRKAIEKALDLWDLERQIEFADAACLRFEFRNECQRLSELLL